MASFKLYLDTRSIKSDGTAPLKLSYSNKSSRLLISLGISVQPSQWDSKAGKVTGHPRKAYYNTFLTQRMLDADTEIIKLSEAGQLGSMTMKQLKAHLISVFDPNEEEKQKVPIDLFVPRLLHFVKQKTNIRTKEIYMATLSRLRAYKKNMDELTFSDITKDWLAGFDKFLSKQSPSINARAIHFRNIRAVFNDAIDDEITTCYPFRKFKIKKEATRKRALPLDDLRKLFDYPVEDFQEKYRDFFKLSFFLIGINAGDLCKLVSIKDGRIDFHRAKTNRLYSIKVEPEAEEIINRYKGKTHLLNVLDTYTDYRHFLKRANDNLQLIGPTLFGKQGKKTYNPLWPELTTYWARHSWATIAASLDIPKDTIAAALGHGGNTVTDVYIDFDQRKVDEANRKVLDWVLYGKK